MGRHSSDSEEDRKKRKKKKKKRSRSRSKSSESRYSSKAKKSKKSKKKHKSRSRSRSVESYRRSRSRSRGRRSRSRSRSKYSRRSRSLSRGRYSRSRSRDRRKRRSRSYDKYTRRSRSPSRKDRGKTSEERQDPCLIIPGFSELTPGEQAKIRMQMALRAAAAADEKIKGENTQYQGSSSLKDQLAFNQAILDIETSGFESQYFKSNRGDKREEKTTNKEEFTFGTAGEMKLESAQKKPVLVDIENDELADPSLYMDQEVKMDKWIQKLSAMRRKKLEGEALS